jgi:hypothetical protein
VQFFIRVDLSCEYFSVGVAGVSKDSLRCIICNCMHHTALTLADLPNEYNIHGPRSSILSVNM